MTGKGTRGPKRGTEKKKSQGHENDCDIPADTPNGDSNTAEPNNHPPDKSADYEVGYGKPPRHSQFKPGTSGHPQGRNKRARGRRAIFEMISNEIVKIRDNGKIKRVSREEAFQRNLYAGAFASPKGVPPLLIYMRTIGATVDEDTARELQITADHEAIVADFLAQHTSVQGPSADDAEEPEANDPASPKKEEDEL